MRRSLLSLTLFCAVLVAPSVSFAQSSPSSLPDSRDTMSAQPDSGKDSPAAPEQEKAPDGGSSVSSLLDASKTITGAVTTGIEAVDTLGKAVTEITQGAVLPSDYNGETSGNSWLPDAEPIPASKMFSALSVGATGAAVAADLYGFSVAAQNGDYLEAGKRATGLGGIEMPGLSGVGSIACDIMNAVQCAVAGDWWTAGSYGSAAIAKTATCTIGATLGAPLGEAAAGRGCDIGVSATETAIAVGRPALERPIISTLTAASKGIDRISGSDDRPYGFGWVPRPLTLAEQQALSDDNEDNTDKQPEISPQLVEGPERPATHLSPSSPQGTWNFGVCFPPNYQTCQGREIRCFCHFVPGGWWSSPNSTVPMPQP